MISHFKEFWQKEDSPGRCTAAAKRLIEVAKTFGREESVISDVEESTDKFAENAKSLTQDEFFFGFNIYAVDQVHMHVLPMRSGVNFREHSTGVRDERFVSAQVVVEWLESQPPLPLNTDNEGDADVESGGGDSEGGDSEGGDSEGGDS
jgi:diadenosine tetraphosphate (Ap4A) HIT family hydrolase